MNAADRTSALSLIVMKLPGELCQLLSSVAYVLTVQKTVSVSCVAVYA